jgi:hypothetical protein
MRGAHSRNLTVAVAMLALAGCTTREPLPPALPPLTTGFAAGLGDVVEVTMTDPQPVEQASLVAADGKAFPAYQISRDHLPAAGQPGMAAGLGLGIFGGTYSNGVSSGFGLGFPFFGSAPPPAEPVVQCHALIRVADMPAYRASWQNWKLHLRLGTPETSERDVEFPAPRPPENS